MNNKLKVFLLVVVMSFVMVGCGGGGGGSGSGTPVVDNSTLADGENQYGYFGNNVIFANTTVAKMWDFYDRDDNLGYVLYARFNTDGDGFMASPTLAIDRKYIDYGVSKDGRVIKTGGDYSATITFKSILYGFNELIDENGNSTLIDCYDVTFVDIEGTHNAAMCPSPFFN